MVYDIIPSVPSAVGNVTVNASIYDVDCLAVPPANLTHISGHNFSTDPSGYQYELDLAEVGTYLLQVPCEWTNHSSQYLRSNSEHDMLPSLSNVIRGQIGRAHV